MKLIDADDVIREIKEHQAQSSKMKAMICYLQAMPGIKTKQIKYFDDEESVWKVGRVIVDE